MQTFKSTSLIDGNVYILCILKYICTFLYTCRHRFIACFFTAKMKGVCSNPAPSQSISIIIPTIFVHFIHAFHFGNCYNISSFFFYYYYYYHYIEVLMLLLTKSSSVQYKHSFYIRWETKKQCNSLITIFYCSFLESTLHCIQVRKVKKRKQ